uniref:tRNA (adenine(58)-N(1))-methyltransferase non-catalytic subunit TRM6 n=1 Tax=Cannabis sativa TaxID=3483 RepID=A0A803PG08_CANSA
MADDGNTKSSLVENSRVTWEGCSVLLDINDGDRLVFARLSAGATLKIGNKNYSLKHLINCPFGSVFSVETGSEGSYLTRSSPSSLEGKNNAQENNGCESKKDESLSKDNRALVDDNKAQTLTGEDIDAMRREGVTGDDIVEALIANSSTFENKTLFSQEKYRIKKQKKYAPKVILRRPVARSICEAYFKKYPSRIGFLRVDTLSLLLSFANISANSEALVVDMVGGLLTGAVAERMGGTGTGQVCSTYLGKTPYSIEIVRIFNFGNDICKSILKASLQDLMTSSSSTENGSLDQNDNGTGGDDSSNMKGVQGGLLDQNDQTPDGTSQVMRSCNKSVNKAGQKAPKEAIKLWKENGFSSLIVAAPDLDTWSLVKDLLPLLSNSAPFAIYHQFLQPLATCMHNLQLEKMAIGLQISEPWLREYQVTMPQSNVVILTDPASDLSISRNGVTVYPIQGEYSRDKLMLQRIRSYIAFLETRLQELSRRPDYVKHYIFTDSDIAVVDNLGSLFHDFPNFHLALTFRNNKDQPLNSGFIAVRGTVDGISRAKIFLQRVLEVYKSKYINASRMLGDQLALAWVVKSHPSFDTRRFSKPQPFLEDVGGASVLFLPCAVYNWTPPEGAGQFHGMPLDVKVVHFKGSRKRLMLESWNFFSSSSSDLSDMLCLVLKSGRTKYDF